LADRDLAASSLYFQKQSSHEVPLFPGQLLANGAEVRPETNNALAVVSTSNANSNSGGNYSYRAGDLSFAYH
jgi:hypothetical protein